MEYKTITGGCHCGNISYELNWPKGEFPITVRECSCSFCQKHGAVYTSHPQSALSVKVKEQNRILNYRFGHETADFVMCGVCGNLMFAICPLEGRDYAVINTNNFDNIDVAELIHSVTNFDLESIEVRLARRKQNWTPTVVFDRAE